MLGEGAAGKVFLAYRKINGPRDIGKSSAPVAIKILDKKTLSRNDYGITNLLQEIKVHWALEECGGVLHLLEIYEDENFIYLVLEYQAEGSLLNEIFKQQRL